MQRGGHRPITRQLHYQLSQRRDQRQSEKQIEDVSGAVKAVDVPPPFEDPKLMKSSNHFKQQENRNPSTDSWLSIEINSDSDIDNERPCYPTRNRQPIGKFPHGASPYTMFQQRPIVNRRHMVPPALLNVSPVVFPAANSPNITPKGVVRPAPSLSPHPVTFRFENHLTTAGGHRRSDRKVATNIQQAAMAPSTPIAALSTPIAAPSTPIAAPVPIRRESARLMTFRRNKAQTLSDNNNNNNIECRSNEHGSPAATKENDDQRRKINQNQKDAKVENDGQRCSMRILERRKINDLELLKISADATVENAGQRRSIRLTERRKINNLEPLKIPTKKVKKVFHSVTEKRNDCETPPTYKGLNDFIADTLSQPITNRPPLDAVLENKLTRAGLGKYCELFEREEIDMNIFPYLTVDDIRHLGIINERDVRHLQNLTYQARRYINEEDSLCPLLFVS